MVSLPEKLPDTFHELLINLLYVQAMLPDFFIEACKGINADESGGDAVARSIPNA